MLLFKCKPTTAGTRIKKKLIKINLYNYLFNFFIFKKTKKSGRTFSGLITTRHKKNALNFYTTYLKNSLLYKNTVGIVISFFFLKNYKCFSLLKFSDGSFSITNTTANIFIGSYFFFFASSHFFSFFKYNYLLLSYAFLLKISSLVSFIQLMSKNQPTICRASGVYAQIASINIDKKIVTIILPSGLKKNIDFYSVCNLGRVCSELKQFTITGKAGINSNLGIRPTVRGNAMNPIDHPHGGRTKTSQPEVSPWGWVAKKNK